MKRTSTHSLPVALAIALGTVGAATAAHATDTMTLNGAYYNVPIPAGDVPSEGSGFSGPAGTVPDTDYAGGGNDLNQVVAYLQGQATPANVVVTASGTSPAVYTPTQINTFALNGNSPAPTSTFTETQTQFVSGLNLGGFGTGNDNYILNFTGGIDASAAGAYTIYQSADDEVALYINGTLATDMQYRQNGTNPTITLSKGYNPIDIVYYQGNGGADLYMNLNPSNETNPGTLNFTNISPAPEPSQIGMIALMGLGLGGLLLKSRKKTAKGMMS